MSDNHSLIYLLIYLLLVYPINDDWCLNTKGKFFFIKISLGDEYKHSNNLTEQYECIGPLLLDTFMS